MKYLLFILSFFFWSCQNQNFENDEFSIEKFDEFKSTEKFLPNDSMDYVGVLDEEKRKLWNEIINEISDEFQIVESENSELKYSKYQKVIKNGIVKLIPIKTTNEDRLLVCYYIQQLKDLTNVKGDEGKLAWYLEENELKK